MSAFSNGMEWASALDMVRVLTEEEREGMAESGHQEDEYARWFAWWYSSESVLGVVKLCGDHGPDAIDIMYDADRVARSADLPCGVGRVTSWGQLCALSVYTPMTGKPACQKTTDKLLTLVPLPAAADLWRLLA